MGEGALQVVVAVVLVAAALSPLALSLGGGGGVVGPAAEVGATEESRPDPGFVEWTGPGDGLDDPDGSAPAAGPPGDRVHEEVRVVAKIRENADVPDRVERQYGDVYTREGARRLSGTLSLSEVRDLSTVPAVEGVRIQGEVAAARSDALSPGVDAVGAAALHDRGIDGDGVVVGVIDSGFRLSHPSVAPHLGAYRSFSGRAAPNHGTAVASVVADTAPGAELHLAAIGPTTSPSEYRAAVDWLRESGADVIVDAGSYFGQPGDGSGTIASVARNASEDVAFVTSAGNYANRHWVGVHRPADDSRYVDVAPDVEGNHLGGGSEVAGRVEVGLTWNGSADYDLYLVRDTRGGDMVVASSSDTDGGGEYLTAVVPRGRYYVAIHPNGSTADRAPTRLELFANRELRHRTPEGSVTAPASAEGVIAVGAYANGSVEPFSSRGPLADGRRGVDLVAPDGVRVDGVEAGGGTSFAAPYVAGTIALLAEAFPDRSTAEVTELVRANAVDVGPEGPDPATGYGLVDARAALEAVDDSPTDADEAANESDDDATETPFPPGSPAVGP